MKSSARPESDGIDRQSYEPAYVQLASILRQQIANGVYRPGDRLPSESQLCAQYGVSPMTVRRVINKLAEMGVVTAYQGKGTFARSFDIGEATFRLEQLKDTLSRRQDTQVRLLQASIVTAEERAAHKLRVNAGERLVYIRRLLIHEGTPVIYHREYLIYDPRRPIVETELRTTSLEGLFRGEGGDALRAGDLTIEAITLLDEEARLLDVRAGSPAFSLEHTFYDFDRNPVSWGWFLCRADQFKLTSRIGDADLWERSR